MQADSPFILPLLALISDVFIFQCVCKVKVGSLCGTTKQIHNFFFCNAKILCKSMSINSKSIISP